MVVVWVYSFYEFWILNEKCPISAKFQLNIVPDSQIRVNINLKNVSDCVVSKPVRNGYGGVHIFGTNKGLITYPYDLSNH